MNWYTREMIEHRYGVELKLNDSGTAVYFEATGGSHRAYELAAEDIAAGGERLRLEMLSRRLTQEEKRAVMALCKEHGMKRTARMLATSISTIDGVVCWGRGRPSTIARLRTALAPHLAGK